MKLVLIPKGTVVYVPDDEHEWLTSTVIQHDKEDEVHVNVTGFDGTIYKRVLNLTDKKVQLALGNTDPDVLASLPCANEDATTHEGTPDMIRLNYLHEPAILYNLKQRFENGFPYTYTGDITIAINPYQRIPELYSEATCQAYMKATDRDALPPHVYATSVASYDNMKCESKDQSILVSGESGAGKTETTKILMNHLATIAGGLNNATIQKIVQVTPLLESFGNAKTTRNDNSSRFGKFTQLQFDARHILVGAKCETYLLEKTRVIGHEEGERNYHIFYQLLDAPEAERAALHIDSKMEYTFIGKNHHDKIEGKADGEHFEDTKKALSLIGMVASSQVTMFKAIAGVLNLGQLIFEKDPGNDEASILVKNAASSAVAELLEVSEEALEKALCTRMIKAGGEVYNTLLSKEDAENCRNALAKAIYAKTFDSLVYSINASLSNDAKSCRTIGVLDIFGFEHFKHNSFEQFCINFANEKLQQKFTQDVFKSVQLEYDEEGISWSHITFADNQDVLSVIESKMGVISLLNEETKMKQGTEGGFVNKITSFHKADNAKVIQFPKTSQMQFTILHYAAPVTYEVTGFLEKNRDSLLPDLATLMRSSSSSFITEMFPPSKGPGGSLRTKTVGTQFQESLSELMTTIQATKVYYVRCIKPNSVKSPSIMEQGMVVSQLRCAGVIEAIRISRTAYPNRLVQEQFIERFWLFAIDLKKKSIKDQCIGIAKKFDFTSPEQYQMGHTKMFFQVNSYCIFNENMY